MAIIVAILQWKEKVSQLLFHLHGVPIFIMIPLPQGAHSHLCLFPFQREDMLEKKQEAQKYHFDAMH